MQGKFSGSMQNLVARLQLCHSRDWAVFALGTEFMLGQGTIWGDKAEGSSKRRWTVLGRQQPKIYVTWHLCADQECANAVLVKVG